MEEDDTKAVRQLLIQCVSISGVTEESWTEDNMKVLDRFILNTLIPSVVVYVHTSSGLQVDYNTPFLEEVVDELCYITRTPGAIIMEETFEAAVQFHTVKGDPLHALLEYMTCVHAPQLALSSYRDRSIKDDYTKDMHCFIACLTDDWYKKASKTVLYIPMEALQCTLTEACKDKKLIQRIEIMMIHWTDQIKELLNAQEIVDNRDNCGPLQEIAFWESHSNKLSEVSKQLEKPEVKHIQDIALLVKSVYVESFCKLAKEIQDCSLQAESNKTFLSILKQPCEELFQLKPRQIPSKLKDIVSFIRIIWNNSPHYNSNRRITGLFCQMSNEIIRLCTQSLSLDKVFDNYSSSIKQDLDDCIYCCVSWKDVYLHAKQIHLKYSDKSWVLDETKVFWVIDVFIKRLRDLLKVCNYQHQFARWEDGWQRDMPYFRVCNGPDLTHNLQHIEELFHHGLQNLRSVDKSILSVKDPTWNNAFNSFCELVKQLEMLMENLINLAFKTMNTVQEGVRLLDIFRHMSSNENIKRLLEKKAEEVNDIFHKELKLVGEERNQRNWYTPDHVPKVVSRILRTRALRQHLDGLMELLQMVSFMPDSPSRKQISITHGQLGLTLDEIERKNYLEWIHKLDGEIHKKLEQPLLKCYKNTFSTLTINFDNDLLNLLSETHYLEQLKFDIPPRVSNIYQSREDIRVLRGNVLLLVKNYHRILRMLSPEELSLFQDKIRSMNWKIQLGLTKQTWFTISASNHFINECLLHVDKIQLFVDEYKASKLSISNLCLQISETLLVNINGKIVYRSLEFVDDQKTHQQSRLQILCSLHRDIVNTMTHIYSIFAPDGFEVQEHWVAYTEKVDRMVEEGFRCNIRNSMKKLSRAIIGEYKNMPSPLFKVLVTLRQTSAQAPPTVEFSPSLRQLAQIVDILPQLISVISEFKRLPDLLTSTESQAKPIYLNIEQDEGIRKIQAAITAGMSANASKLQVYLQHWDKYKSIWEMNKNFFIQRYKSKNHPVSSFDTDLKSYSEHANNIQQEETIFTCDAVMLDCSPLKSSLVQHCNEWQNKFTELLSQLATTQLQDLNASMQNNTNRLKRPPQTLAELSESLKLLETLQGTLTQTEAQISLVHEQFAVLDKYEVYVEKSVQVMHEGLNEEWVAFQQVLIDGDIMLQKQKKMLKNSLVFSYEELKKKTEATVEEFNTKGPFRSTLSVDSALDLIADHRIQLEALKEKESTIFDELAYFKIKQPPSKKIQMLEKDIDKLQEVWEITKEWDAKWNEWKVVHLAKLQTENMESTAQEMLKKLHVLQREVKNKSWEIVDFSMMKIEQFKHLIPLITDLRNPAMRDRHWKELCEKVQFSFDHNSDEFTLEKIVSLGLDHFTDQICEISGAASKELLIEQKLGLYSESSEFSETKT